MISSAPYAAGSDTSQAAAVSIEPHVDRLEGLVLNAIKSTPAGMTCDEVEQETGLLHTTASARINSLHHKKGLIRDSGQRRKTRSGRGAAVWVAN